MNGSMKWSPLQRVLFTSAMPVAALVAGIGLDPARVAVERNLEIVPRSTLGDVSVSAGDAFESDLVVLLEDETFAA